ncbi:hypothetical protein IR123_09970 [Streptococcus sp. 19428wC2_LYSM12]|nr:MULTISPECIES: hypothetical protein [unclassified Streptococcus]MBF0788201.1 hypothetical protein [Streptococcus sp. 19428wC2_LYSM12]
MFRNIGFLIVFFAAMGKIGVHFSTFEAVLVGIGASLMFSGGKKKDDTV